jgi:hypothetical protein
MVEKKVTLVENKKGGGQPHLAVQDAATVDPSKLTALTPEVVSFGRN